ncbi:MAG TPA: hypothetical protein VEZ71_06900, partial [Archangium sp.]|nr:hypothetical protein [Archangium sp.]
MDKATPRIGIAIKQGTDFMRGVYQEISALFGELDDVLREKHWISAWYNYLVFRSNSNAVDQLHLRFPETMGRAYAHEPSPGQYARHAAIIEVHLSPSFGADEAMLVLAIATLGKPLGSGQIAEMYRNSAYFMGTLLREGEYTLGTAKALTPQERRGVFADCPELHVVAWPLVEMTGRDALART